MVTEAVSAPARQETAFPYAARLLLTIVLLALYWFARRIPLPGVDMNATLEFSHAARSPETAKNVSIMALGLTPLITGFLLVELFALMTSPGRRLRKDGTAGRAKLNRAALMISLLVSAIQAVGISMFLTSVTTPGGAPLVTAPGWGFRLLAIATLTAVTAAVFILGNILSGYGIGNGFALLLVVNLGLPVLEQGMMLGFEASQIEVWGLLLAGVFTLLLLHQFRKADALQIPAFPQSLVPGQLAFLLWLVFKSLGVLPPHWDLRAVQPVVVAVAVALFSLLTFHLFSSRPRLEANLPETDEVLDRLEDTLRRRLLPSTVFLALGTAAFLAWGDFQPVTFAAFLAFQPLACILATALDLWDQFQLNRRQGATARLVQLDNVYFSYRLVALLREEEIEALARGRHFRSLFFFFVPLFKIDVLVPVQHFGRAREIFAKLETAREIKAF
jgi:preprotein translocase subunit SecY